MDVSSASETGPAELLSYRQRLEKAAGGDIVLMEWSPTIDLLAATLADDSVLSYTRKITAQCRKMCPCLQHTHCTGLC